MFAILRNLTRLKVLDLSRSDAITGDLASLRDVRGLHSLHLPDLQVTGTRAQVEDVRDTGRVLEFLCGLVRKKTYCSEVGLHAIFILCQKEAPAGTSQGP